MSGRQSPTMTGQCLFSRAGVGTARERAEQLFRETHPDDSHPFTPEQKEKVLQLIARAFEAIDVCEAEALQDRAGNA